MDTTASMMTVSEPMYYSDGNVKSVRMGGVRSDLEMYMADQAWVCDK
jgi:hypothetical protein